MVQLICAANDLIKGHTEVAQGTVMWFNPTKGYGFIRPDGGSTDVFVHISAVERAGYASPPEGIRVSYGLVDRSGRSYAHAHLAHLGEGDLKPKR
jgi:CspA family cold shock protein